MKCVRGNPYNCRDCKGLCLETRGNESLPFTSTPFPTSQSVGITDDMIPKDLSNKLLVVV